MTQTPPPHQQQPGSPASSSASSNIRFSPSYSGLAVLGQGLDLEESVTMNFTGNNLHSGQQRLRSILEARRTSAATPARAIQPEIDSSGGVITGEHRFISDDPVDNTILESLDNTLPLVTTPALTAPVPTPVPAAPPAAVVSTTAAVTPAITASTTQPPTTTPIVTQAGTVVPEVGGPSQPNQPVTNTSAAAGVMDLSWVIPPGYPPLDEIFTDFPDRAASLYESGFVGQLSIVAASVIKRAGTKVYTLSPTHAVGLTAYDQLILAVICKYYSSLPNVEFTPEVHQALHVTYAYHVGRPVIDNAETKEFYLQVSSEGLENVVMLLARLLMPDATLSSRSVFDNTTTTASKSLMDRVRTQCPTAVVAYRMMYQLLYGGIECISPIPDILRFDDNFSTYINRMAKGNSSIVSTNIVSPSRDNRLPIVQPPITVVAPISPLPEAVTAVTTQALIPAASVVGYGDTVAATQAPNPTQPQPTVQAGVGTAPPAWAGTVAPVTLATPSDFVQPVNPLAAATTGLPVRPPIPNIPTQLIPQGAPRHDPVMRDTTMFRQSVTNHAELVTSVNLVMEVCANNSTDILGNREILQDIVRRIANLEQAFNSAMVVNAAQDLNLRLNLNRTIATPANPAMAAAAAGAVPVQSPNQVRAQQYAAQLRDPNCLTNYPNLAAELSAYLREMGHPAVAATVTQSFLQTERARMKLAARLGTL